MISADPSVTAIALLSGVLAALVWVIVLVRVLVALCQGRERRATWLVMAVFATLASIGASASALAMSRGLIGVQVDPVLLSFIASVGRGALIAAGVIVLTTYRPGRA